MLNLFKRLKHIYSLQINRFETGFIHAKQVHHFKTLVYYAEYSV